MPRPNILIILTDQQHARMLGCVTPWVKTPAMDALAAGGTRFARAYCANPVCIPSRFCLFTGLRASAIGMINNDFEHLERVPEAMSAQGMGWAARAAGYDAIYGGKQHFPKLDAGALGFEVLTRDERDGLAESCAAFLAQPRAKPFLLVASFINPHDICFRAIRAFQGRLDAREAGRRNPAVADALDRALALPPGMSEDEFFATVCPPLPPNHDPPPDEPEALTRFIASRPSRDQARRGWSERDWRLQRWAYARLTTMVDAQIGRVLDALEAAGRARDTLVIFTSDHGDNDASRRLEQKGQPYEESAGVPLIMRLPGEIMPGRVDDRRLACNGLDLLPTVRDYLGLPAPTGVEGLSLRAPAEGRDAPWREHLTIETVTTLAVCRGTSKLVRYSWGRNREQLFDLAVDPYEQRSLAGDPGRAGELRELRGLMRRHAASVTSGPAAALYTAAAADAEGAAAGSRR